MRFTAILRRSVQLAWEAEAASHTTHCSTDKVVEVTISRRCQLQCAEADVVQGLIVQKEALVCILDKLVEGKDCVVGFYHCVGDFGRRNHRERLHNAVWILLTDLGDEKSSHASTSATTEGVAQLESLQAVTAFCFLTYNGEHRIDQFGAFRGM